MLIPDLCLYHANCPDGFGAAYAVWKRCGDACTYVPMHYGQALDWSPLMVRAAQGLESCVVCVDYTLPREVLFDLHARGHQVLVIDHHVTAQEDLRDVPFPLVFDLDSSGAVLAWAYFHPEDDPPRLIAYIQDRDLWRFALPHSRAASMYVATYREPSFPAFELLCARFHTAFETEVVPQGTAILRYADQLVHQMAARAASVVLAGHTLPCVNATVLFSEVGEALCQAGHPAAAYWFRRGDVYQWGLRSAGAVDVAQIARQYGGGGHRAAAGFTLTPAQHRAVLQEDTPCLTP